jgi:integrase
MTSSKGTKAAQPGVVFSKDSSGVVTWPTPADANQRGRRFVALQRLAITAPDTTEGVLAIRLVCLDGIHPDALPVIEKTKCSPYKITIHHAIEWQANSPNRLERRLISALTVRCWANQDQPALARSLQDFLKNTFLYHATTNPLHEVKLDFECWLNEVLPASLFAHCCGQSCLSALERSTWGRLETKKALAPEDAVNQKEQDPDVGSTGVIIDAAMDGRGKAISTVLLKTVLDILSEKHTSNIDGLTKRRWAIEIGKLSGRVSSSNAKTGILIAWPVHMCEAGTLAESNPAASTIQNYTRRALLKLAAAIEQLNDDPEEWDLHKLLAIYQILLSAESTTTRGILSAALSNFHYYLTEWFDISPLEFSLQAGTSSEQSVLAEVIWPHEVRWCIETTSRAPAPIIARYSQAMLHIASEQGVRIQDLQRLRMCSIHFAIDALGSYCEIEVARDASRGRLKTVQSQRRLIIRQISAIDCIQQLVTQRQREGATGSAFLFGDPADDKNRYQPGAIHAYLNTLIKHATGAPHARFHALRHTAISLQVEVAWCSSTIADVNPLEIIAAASGHISPFTTLRTYSHLYEQPIRFWLNLALHEMQGLLTKELGDLVNLKPNTLLQTARRKGLSPLTCAWHLLDAKSQSLRIGSAAEPFQWTNPKPVVIRSPQDRTLTVAIVERSLQDLILGITIQAIALRLQVEVDSAEVWLATLMTNLRDQVRICFPRANAHMNLGAKSLMELIELLGGNMARTRQAKYHALCEYFQSSPDHAVLQAAVHSWSDCTQGKFIALNPAYKSRGLLQLLKQSKVNRDRKKPHGPSLPHHRTYGSRIRRFLDTSLISCCLGPCQFGQPHLTK